ncbi:MAG: antibiotic biosynthesis monooxygenase [Candidatus Aminicenantales bacterium]
MYARLTTMSIKPEKIDEAIKIYRTSVVPAAKSQQGFVGAYLLTDRPTGRGISLTIWKTEEDALANEHNRYYQEQLVKFIEFFQSPPIREGYEISVKG